MALETITKTITKHWGVTVAVIVACLVVLYLSLVASHVFPEPDPTFWYSGWVLILSAAVFVVLMVASQTPQEFLSYFVFALAGGAAGWITGMIASPSSPDEAKIFGEYKSAIVGFLSGFAASKISSLWDILTKDTSPRLFQRAYITRILLFTAFFGMLAAQQYLVRQSSVRRMMTAVSVEPIEGPAKTIKDPDSLTVSPGSAIILSGAADYEEIGVDWTIRDASLDVLKAFNAVDGKVKVQDGLVKILIGRCEGESKTFCSKQTATIRATSRWNRSSVSDFKLTIEPEKPVANGAQPK
jgi:hypothetical protein